MFSSLPHPRNLLTFPKLILDVGYGDLARTVVREAVAALVKAAHPVKTTLPVGSPADGRIAMVAADLPEPKDGECRWNWNKLTTSKAHLTLLPRVGLPTGLTADLHDRLRITFPDDKSLVSWLNRLLRLKILQLPISDRIIHIDDEVLAEPAILDVAMAMIKGGQPVKMSLPSGRILDPRLAKAQAGCGKLIGEEYWWNRQALAASKEPRLRLRLRVADPPGIVHEKDDALTINFADNEWLRRFLKALASHLPQKTAQPQPQQQNKPLSALFWEGVDGLIGWGTTSRKER